MSVQFADIWDFHTDLRLIQRLPPDRGYLKEQLDLPTALQLGGLFTATGRFADLPAKEQIDRLEDEVNLIRGAPGLGLVLTVNDLEGTGNQLLHAEGIYFIEKEEDIELLGRLWALGFRSLAPMYNEDNLLGGGATGESGRGLTKLGRDFALHAWDAGFILDCAHANHRTKNDLVDLALVTGNPVHYSHGHLDKPVVIEFGERGLPRETACRIFETGGLVGLSPHPGFLGAFERHLEEIDFLAEICPDQVVLGTDFAGTNTPGPGGRRLFDECRGVWGIPGYANRLADIHGEDFSIGYCGRILKTYLRGALP
ncbi:membrane dipeptidase [Nitrospinota bacterium]